MTENWKARFYKRYASTAGTQDFEYSDEEYEANRLTGMRVYGKYLPEDPSTPILDIACGGGQFLYFLQKNGYAAAEGIDLSGEQIAVARSKGVANLRCGDYRDQLRSRPGYYGLITAHHFIEHLSKDEIIEFLESIFEALRPGGRVLVSTGNVASLFGASHICADFTHETGFTPRSLQQVLMTMGFEEVTVEGVRQIPLHLKARIRLVLWELVKKMLRFLLVLERGGLGKKDQYIVEINMFGTGLKPGVLPSTQARMRIKTQKASTGDESST
jgi:2-polyprenyl-3-methyl-5-hydroxy-6-metoxy-1,4-benzoquinol methylase